MAKKKEKPNACEFELYDKETHNMTTCGKEPVYRSLKKNKLLCEEHGEYAMQFLGKYDVIKIKGDKQWEMSQA